MKTLSLDIETYSPVDLKSAGVYKYAEHPDFEILLLAYSVDGGPVQVGRTGRNFEGLPSDVADALTDPTVIKHAHNAAFERTCLAAYYKTPMPPEQWRCTMVLAAMAGLPMALDQVAKALNAGEQKDSSGKALIRYFCQPCKPTKTNGGRTRNTPETDPEKWQQFKDYCAQDVRAEMAIADALKWYKPTPEERRMWILDQRINDRGVQLDPVLVSSAIAIDAANTEALEAEAIELTGLQNPNSVSQLKAWLESATGEAVESLNKEKMPALIEAAKSYLGEHQIVRVLEIRQQTSKSSIKKYGAMQACMCADDRARGLLQYYGANRTGRWGGRMIQPQNLARNSMKGLTLARQVIRDGDLDTARMLYDNVPDVLSQLVRTAFVPRPGCRFIVSDFAAIEARVIAWLAGEKWRMDVFATHGKIYEASASQMFKVPLDKITKDLRSKGKVAELALGYQGGPNALERMGALKMGLKQDELPALVKMWRNANKKIVNLWQVVQDLAQDAVTTGPQSFRFGIKFFMRSGALHIQLPSGRCLVYQSAKVIDGPKGPQLVYNGTNQMTKVWGRQDTYGGKLVENIVQAIARDLLAAALVRLEAAGYPVAIHVHDEAVIEKEIGQGSMDEVNKIMGDSPGWAAGLPTPAESFECDFYKKD